MSAASLRSAVLHGLGSGMNGEVDLRATLEREYAADQALLFGSGTQALQAALRLAMRQVESSVVALPAFTCFDVAAAAVGAHARIRLYDLDPTTLAPDLASLQRILERGIRVAVIAPLYGFPVDWDALSALLARFGAIAVEDAAQGNHATWRGRALGSLGPISVLSFGRGKGWTGGDGGALLIRDQPPWRGLREALKEMSVGHAGRTAEWRVVTALAAQWAFGRPAYYAIPHALPWLHLGETVYKHPEPPRAMTRAASACLASTRSATVREGAARHARAVELVDAIEWGTAVRAIPPLPGATPGYLRLPLGLAHGIAGFPQPKTAARLGIAPSYPSTVAVIPEVRPWVDDATLGWPGGEELVRTLCTLPTHSLVTGTERSELIQQLQTYAREA